MSTCHWCHVMERESFENDSIAEVLNKYFVSIKVDREERPDIDNVYMTACQAMTGHGGWPLSIFMTPDKYPFFAGTYFPAESRWGRPGFGDLLLEIAGKWEQDRDRIFKAGEDIAQKLSSILQRSGAGEISEDVLHKAFNDFKADFDDQYGGFSPAPKFPTPHNLFFLLRYWKNTGEEEALHMVEKTLQSMHKGGIYDHVGFGFSRYSTDNKWLVPHFEKMLYDNALLAAAYLEAYQVTGKGEYARVAGEIFTYVLRDMSSPEGGFYSAEDADSEGEEGKFYVWTPEEVNEILGEEKGRLFCEVYDITEGGNFEGKNIPNLIKAETGLTEETAGILEESRNKLFEEREKRVHPYKDDKILTAWNGLMIASLARGAAVLREEKYAREAEKAAEFIWEKLRGEDGRLMARYREGEAKFKAYLDDYAFLALGMLNLYEAVLNPVYLKRAIELTEQMLELFYDRQDGGFFFYGSDAENLFARPKDAMDGAMPSGNSAAALLLQRLGRFSGDARYLTLAEDQVKAFGGDVTANPRAYSFFLTAIQFALYSAREIVVAGKPEDREVEKMIAAVQQRFLPETVLIMHPVEGKEKEEIEELIPYVKEQIPLNGKPAAYICKDFACRSPLAGVEELEEVLN